MIGRTPCFLGMAVIFAACSHASTDRFSGTIQATSATVGSPVGGRVTAVLVQDGQRVRSGQVLVRFDDAQQQANLDGARHEVVRAAAALADLRAGAREPDLARAGDQALAAREEFESARLAQARQISILRGQLAQAQALLVDVRANAKEAATQAERARSLFSTGDVSAAYRDAANAAETRAQAQVASAQDGVANARAQLRNSVDVIIPRNIAETRAAYGAAENSYRSLAIGARPGLLRQAEASLALARSNVQNAQAQAADMLVRAPAAGVVGAMNLHVGDIVGPNAAVATIDENGEPFVRIYVPQSLLGRVRVGARVAVYPDSQTSLALAGTVEQIDQQAQFTPENVQTSDDRATLSFGVKIRINDRDHRLHGGTTATVRL
ncbi:MAG: HlyD family secretion protein [Vulcanimicrobiaceae bacterium]